MAVQIKNNAKSILTLAITTISKSIDLTPGDGVKFPTLTSGDWFYITLVDQLDPTLLEIVKVTAISSDRFTIERAQEGTIARAFNIGDTVSHRLTTQTMYDLLPAEPVKARKYLDEFYLTLRWSEPPASASELVSRSYKNAPLLMNKWDSYWGDKLKVQIEDTTTNVIYDNLIFNTVQDMIDWTAANGTLNGLSADQTFVARPYETIDETIPVPTKMYGLNRFYSALRGGGNYTSARSATAKNSKDMESHCTLMFNRAWGTSIANVPLDAVWLSRAKKNLYVNPRFLVRDAYRIPLSGGVRTVWNTNTSTFVSNTSSHIPSHMQNVFTNNTPDDTKWGVLYNNGTLNVYDRDQWKEIPSAMRNGASVVAVTPIQAIVDTNEHAIAVKPLGVDQVLVHMPDFTIYDFEMIFFNNERQNYVAAATFTSTADFNYTAFDEISSRMRINSSEWFNVSDNNHTNIVGATGYWNHLKWDTVRFRLRNKITKEVSSLSYSGIVTDNEHKFMMRRMLIRSFEDK